MSLLITLEHAPHRQARQEIRHEGGDLTIGRATDANWTIDDPDMLVSRFHCVISGSDGAYQVTDSSRGGLFVDGSDKPLGAGNSANLEDGMRLRLGDYVLRVHIARQAAPQPVQTIPAARPVAANTSNPGFGSDDFFSVRKPLPEPEVRPAGLPDPFDAPRKPAFASVPAQARQKPMFDDPFTLDPVPSRPASQPLELNQPIREPAPADPFAFDTAPPRRAEPSPQQIVPAAPVQSSPAQRDAFFRGLGLDPAAFAADPEAQMEALGARFRLLVDGVMMLLRNRAQEKQNARIAQTIIGHSEVNPLKFSATTAEALGAMVRDKSPGYLAPEAAITAALRDLAEHNINSWNGVQQALRRMIDRFDPSALEEELKEKSALETLLAGGKRAKLWQLYEERYQQIARSAEDRFLGEVGSDFRDAYEQKQGGKG